LGTPPHRTTLARSEGSQTSQNTDRRTPPPSPYMMQVPFKAV
jgi:hypothetical protein